MFVMKIYVFKIPCVPCCAYLRYKFYGLVRFPKRSERCNVRFVQTSELNSLNVIKALDLKMKCKTALQSNSFCSTFSLPATIICNLMFLHRYLQNTLQTHILYRFTYGKYLLTSLPLSTRFRSRTVLL
jgi:hypothetical protein